MRLAVVMGLLVLAGCLDGPFCTSARATFEGTQQGWLEALPAPTDWQPTLPLAGPAWVHDGIEVTAPLESGRPEQLQTPHRQALWFGVSDGGALFADGEVRVFAHDVAARDRILAAAADASEGSDVGTPVVHVGDEPPYWWEFSLPDDFPRTSWTASAALPAPHATDHVERHIGWYAWGVSPDRTLSSRGDATMEVHLTEGRFTAQVHRDDATEARLRADLEGLAARFQATIVIDDVRYRAKECTAGPPET